MFHPLFHMHLNPFMDNSIGLYLPKFTNPKVICSKVMGLKWLVFLNQSLNFNWYVVHGGPKSKHHKDTCVKEIVLHLQISMTIVHSIVNTIGN